MPGRARSGFERSNSFPRIAKDSGRCADTPTRPNRGSTIDTPPNRGPTQPYPEPAIPNPQSPTPAPQPLAPSPQPLTSNLQPLTSTSESLPLHGTPLVTRPPCESGRASPTL